METLWNEITRVMTFQDHLSEYHSTNCKDFEKCAPFRLVGFCLAIIFDSGITTRAGRCGMVALPRPLPLPAEKNDTFFQQMKKIQISELNKRENNSNNNVAIKNIVVVVLVVCCTCCWWCWLR